MLILEVIGEMIFVELIGGALTKANNLILKLRGIETRSKDQIEFDEQRVRYERKKVKTKNDFRQISKGSKGIVLELVDSKTCLVEFENFDLIEIPTKDLRILLKKN